MRLILEGWMGGWAGGWVGVQVGEWMRAPGHVRGSQPAALINHSCSCCSASVSVCWCCILPCTQRPWDREMNHTALYRAELASIVNTTPGAALVDIFTAWPAADPSWHVRYLLPDWLHLNAAGNAALADALLAAIRKYMPELSPESIPLNWPLMDAISRDDPAAAFNAVVGVAQAGGQGAAAAALLEAGAVGGGAAVSGAESDSSCRRRSLLAVAGGAAVAWQLGME